ncbi:MAG: hypothetical protein WC243_01730 [Patescibacteria group bacterium]|jgi:hypothetical protein
MKKSLTIIFTTLIFLTVAAGVYINIREQKAVDHSKLPEKVELSRDFQRWITNLKNNDVEVGADDFRLLEENEIYNTKWIKIYSLDEEGRQEEYEKYIQDHKDLKKIEFSPSVRLFVDYRNTQRDGYSSNEVHLYGLKEDKILDARILDCSAYTNCYFDRAYFLDNDVFVISEFSRKLAKDQEGQTLEICNTDQTCTYTIKAHVIDLINNKRFVYESKEIDLILSELIPDL